ncbi:MAG TPA: CHAT domain-containing protein [Pseudonocardiaceae bacterium]|nr:CHAT domain-containing protein [Pseudonocardiaceae bacterium]
MTESDHRAVLTLVERGRLAEAATKATSLVCKDDQPRYRLTLAWIELDRGRLAGCARQLAAARPGLTGVELARADCLGGLLRCAAGEHADAVAELSAALPRLRGDDRWSANALVGRGTANGYLRRLAAADADFAAAAPLYERIGEHTRSAACLHNRGFVALQAGDLPLALRRFDEAEAAGLHPARHPEVLIDRAQALVAAGLTGAARPVLTKAAGLLMEAGRGTKLAEALLAVAHCAARSGQPAVAAEAAGRAAVLFGRQGRTPWRPAARAVALASSSARPHVVVRVAAACDRHGWSLSAAELRFAAADRAKPEVARTLLAQVARHRHTGPAPVRALAWLARARLADNDRAVFAACRAGLLAVRRDALTMGAWELRAGMAAHTVALAELGLSTALASGRARSVLRWTDRCRAVAGDRPAVLPPADPEQARRLVALRSAIASGGSPSWVRKLERQVRASDLAARGMEDTGQDWSYPELFRALGDATLVSFLIHNGHYCSVSITDGRCRFRLLGKVSEVTEAIRSLRFASRAGTGTTTRLDELLGITGDRPLVIVPVGGLHTLPWAALPSCRGRAVSVAPSIGAWLRAATPRPTTGEKVWLAGPRLRHAAAEAKSLHAVHGGQLRTGRAATVPAALAAMDGADLVHIAAHGRFREDQPLFSCVELADGPLFGYDVQRLPRPPRRVVLSACDAGRAAVWPGGEAIGMATALLRCGTATVIASLLPVPDRQAVRLVTALHAGLAQGQRPAAALANAQAEHGHLGFSCFGAG